MRVQHAENEGLYKIVNDPAHAFRQPLHILALIINTSRPLVALDALNRAMNSFLTDYVIYVGALIYIIV